MTAELTRSSSSRIVTKPNVAFAETVNGFQSRTSQQMVTIFNDLQSNVTFSALGSIGSASVGRRPGQSVYFEGTNIIVYIHGTDDDEVEWWKADDLTSNRSLKKGGVLVNAHYDRYAIFLWSYSTALVHLHTPRVDIYALVLSDDDHFLANFFLFPLYFHLGSGLIIGNR
jgi:hypothetical protein